jgi:hypothetical protein
MPAGLRVNWTVVGGSTLCHTITTITGLGFPQEVGAGLKRIGELANAVGESLSVPL